MNNEISGGDQSPSTTFIRRAKHDREHPYVMISRAMFRDKSISPKAKGILGYLLSLPDNWVVKTNCVAKEMGIGRDSLYSALKELVDAGYCRISQTRKQEGKFSVCDYEFSEEPIFKKTVPCTGFPDTGFPDTGNPPLRKKEREEREIDEGDASSAELSRPGVQEFSYDWNTGKFINITEAIMADWRDAFPLVPLQTFIPFMEQKIAAQPARYKKRKQWSKLALEFLVREQQAMATRKPTAQTAQTSNQEIAKKYQTSYKSKHYELDVGTESIAVIPLFTQGSPIVLKFNEYGFESQLRNLLEKKDFRRIA